MNIEFKRCLEKTMLVKIDIDVALVDKEIGESDKDLETAKRSLAAGDSKWATIQAYYCVFHAAKALVFLV